MAKFTREITPIMSKKSANRRGYRDFPTRFFMHLSTIEGGFVQIHEVLTEGAFLTILALSFGAMPIHLGILAAIPHMTQIFALIGAYLVEVTGNRRRVVLVAASISRGLWLLVPLLYIYYSPRQAVILLIWLAFASSCLEVLGTNAWTTWMADLIPDTIRGRYFGFRHGVLAAANITVTFFGGLWLDLGGAEYGQPVALSALISLGVTCGFISIATLARQPDIPRPPERKAPRIRDLFLRPARNKPFRRALEFFLAWNMAIGFTKVFYDVHMIQVLNMSFFGVGLFHTIQPVMGLFLFKRWGRVIDRFQTRAVLLVSGSIISILPLIWIVPTSGNRLTVGLIGVLAGIAWTGFNLSAYTYPMEHSPRYGRSYYLAYFTIISGLGFIVSSILGGLIAQTMADWQWTFHDRTFMIHHLMFLIASFLRFGALMMLFRMEIVRAPGTLALINYITKTSIKLFPRWIRHRGNSMDNLSANKKRD
ncbi:MFS transporter [Candidatus Neomarinimicrobiota bacterium]